MIGSGAYALSFGFNFAARVATALFTPPVATVARRPAAAVALRRAAAPVTPVARAMVVTAPQRARRRLPQTRSRVAPGLLDLVLRRLRSVLQYARTWVDSLLQRTGLARMRRSLERKRQSLALRGNGIFEYAVVTAAYWGFTLTDGAIRMLVLFQFHLLGYSAFQIAALFLFYEIFGVLTNFVGGWLAARGGVHLTLFGGTALQIVALLMLFVMSPNWPVGVLVAYTMFSQALSGIAKDLTKMSAKSAIKSVVPKDANPTLYRWVSVLTGSKNALKGAGFFVGALLLTVVGFRASALLMATGLTAMLVVLPRFLPKDLGKSPKGVKFSSIFALDQRINILSAARFFLFGARDIWFVVALPVYMSTVFGWSPMVVGGYLALWTIGYGIVQSLAPRFVSARDGESPRGETVLYWASALAVVPALIAVALGLGLPPALTLPIGLAIFGVVFAVNSAVHSYMIVHYADSEKVAMTIGFYYMANAGGRLAGTVLSGLIYQATGIVGCLWASALFVSAAAVFSARLTAHDAPRGRLIEGKAVRIHEPLALPRPA